jgi:predicted RNase H-like HicB family nuclease
MSESEITLRIHLEIAVKRDGKTWVAWCPPVDVLSQAETKDRAIASLREAVGLWFESCVERGVLDQALTEAGFRRGKDGEKPPADASTVHFQKKRRITRRVAPPRYISVNVPAYARPLNARAAC